MKTIVVPTDFSAAADNAMYYAAALAQEVNASVLLLHVYQLPVSMNDTPVLMISPEDLKKSADVNLERTKDLLLNNHAGLEVTTESRLGDLVDELEDISAQSNPYAIVIGKHSVSGLERLLLGSTDLSIIRHCTAPVICVPDHFDRYSFKKIVLAVDSADTAKMHERVESFLEPLKAQLHLLHVQTTKDDQFNLSMLFPERNPVYATINDDHFSHGIQSYIQGNQIDLLLILPRKHSAVERLIFKTHTAELIDKLPIPLASIYEH
jgi:nucleotide-binding universal stress UspA family protein